MTATLLSNGTYQLDYPRGGSSTHDNNTVNFGTAP
jgi:hypothetical protein